MYQMEKSTSSKFIKSETSHSLPTIWPHINNFFSEIIEKTFRTFFSSPILPFVFARLLSLGLNRSHAVGCGECVEALSQVHTYLFEILN